MLWYRWVVVFPLFLTSEDNIGTGRYLSMILLVHIQLCMGYTGWYLENGEERVILSGI